MQEFPRCGFGTLGDPKKVKDAVIYAVEHAGYRHLDCAWAYFNEKEVGEAIHDLLSRKVIKREELWVTSKLWNNAHHPDDVEVQCRETLKNLQIDYLDLYLVHWPFAVKKVEGQPFPMENGKMIVDRSIRLFDTWKAMEGLVKKGLVKRIGVANFNIELLDRMKVSPEITIQPYTNQVECHLYMQQDALIDYCAKRGIYVTTHTSIGRPSTTQGEPQVLEDEELLRVAKEINRSAANVEIKFLQSLSPYLVVLVKSFTPERIKSNNELDFELSSDQIERLKKRNRYYRFSPCLRNWGVDVWADAW